MPFWPPKRSPGGGGGLGKSAPGVFKTVLRSSWFASFFLLRFGFVFLSVLGSSWDRFGALLGLFWAIVGSLGRVFELSGGHVGAFNFSLDFLFFAFVAAGLAQSVSDNRHYLPSTHLLISSLPINSSTLSSIYSLQSDSSIFLCLLITSSTLIPSTYISIVRWFSSSMMFVLFPSTQQPSPLL